MAKVSLADLMNPLTKIEENTKSVENAAWAIVESVSITQSIQEQMLTELKKQTQLLKKGSGDSGLSAIFGGGGKKSATQKKAGQASVFLKDLGAGTMDLAKGLLVFSLVPKKAVTKFLFFIEGFFEVVDDLDAKKAEEGRQVLAQMGGTIYDFAKSLALSALLIIPGMIAIPFLLATTLLLVGYFTLLGMVSKSVTKGAKALDKMGDAIKSFAIGMAFFALTTLFILMQPVILVGMVASLLLMGGAVALLGRFDKNIKKGSAALFLMGIGLASFAVGYLFFALASKVAAPSMGDLLIQAASILILGIAVGLLGKGLSNIAQGALAIALMGAGLFVFGLGYLPFAMVMKDTSWEDIGKQSALLLALGLEFAAAGIGSLLIVPGAIAFAAVGVALVSLSVGLKAFQAVTWTPDNTKNLTEALVGIKGAFGGAMDPTGGGRSGFMEKMGGVFTSAVNSAGMIAAAGAFTTAGMALWALSKGLTAFKAVGWDSSGTVDIDGVKIGKDTAILTSTLTGISTAFASAGGAPPEDNKSIFGKVFGAAFQPNAVERGIDSVMGAGKALTGIAKGLEAFQGLIGKVDFSDGGKMETAIKNTLGFVSKAFGIIGGDKFEKEDSIGVLGWSIEFDENAVAKGIDAVSGAGKELTQIAKGLMSFQEMVDKDMDFASGGLLDTAVTNTLTFVGDAFAVIGGKETKNTGGFLGFTWDENQVEQGIDAVAGAGKELTQIAEGLMSFQALIDKDVKFYDKDGKGTKGTLAYAVLNTISFVGKAFAAVGGEANEEESGLGIFSWDENVIAKGIEAVKGAGEELTNIAQGVIAFEGIKDPKAIATAISDLFNSTTEVFIKMADNETYLQALEMIQNFFTGITESAEAGTLEKAAKDMGDLAANVNKLEINKMDSLGALMTTFAKANEEMDTGFLSSISGGISDMSEGFNKFFGTTDEQVAEVTEEAGTINTKEEAPMKELQSAIADLNAGISKMNSVLQGLPDDISMIKLKVNVD